MRKRLTELEKAICDQWDELAFRDRPAGSRDAWIAQVRSREADWQRLLERAYIEGRWIIGVSIASMLSGSLWYERMILRDYGGAKRVATRLLEHPQWALAERFDKAHWPIWLYVSELGLGDHDVPARRLIDFVQDGPYRPGEMALLVFGVLSAFLSDLSTGTAPSEALRELGVCLVEAKRAPKKRIAACRDSRTARELIEALQSVFQPKLKP